MTLSGFCRAALPAWAFNTPSVNPGDAWPMPLPADQTSVRLRPPHAIPRLPLFSLLVLGAVVAVLLIVQVLSGPGRRSSEGEAGERKVLSGDASGRLTDPRTRLAEARRLGRTRTVEAAPLLRRFSRDDDDPEVREACVWALGEIGDPESVQAVRIRTTDRSAEVRIAAGHALAKLYGESADKGFDDLLRDPEPRVREEAVKALGTVDDPRATDRLIDALDDAAVVVRLAAAKALADRDGPAATRGMAKALGDENADVRAVAAAAMARFTGQMGGAVGAGLAEADSLEARADAAGVLARTGDPEAAAAIVRLLDGFGRKVRGNAVALEAAVIKALVTVGEPGLDALVREAIDEELDPRAERPAAEACVRIGGPAARRITEALLRWRLFPDPEELAVWVDALGRLGDPAAEPALRRALAQGIEGMDATVARACERIATATGAPFGPFEPEPGLLADAPSEAAYRPIRPRGVLVTPAAPTGATIPESGVVRVTLKGALHESRQGRGTATSDLTLTLTRRDGTWDEAFDAHAVTFNKRDHRGRLVRAETRGTATGLAVEVVFLNDFYRHGAFGAFTVTLEPSGAGLAGTYTGHCHFVSVEGRAEGAAWAQIWPDPAAPPLECGEHPRLLLRRGDVPALRERARTPTGRRLLAALRARLARQKTLYRERVNYITTWQPGADLAIAHGLLYTLFDDAPHARRAQPLVMERTRVLPYGGEHGERLPGPLFHYPWAADLVYPALEPGDQAKVDEALRHSHLLFSAQHGPLGVFTASRGTFGIAGVMALGRVGDRGEFKLPEPVAPPPLVEARADAAVQAEGVPAQAYQPGRVLTQWLVLGPFGGGAADAVLDAMGGAESARPTAAVPVKVRGVKLRFQPLPAEAVDHVPSPTGSQVCLVMPAAEPGSTTLLASHLQVDGEVACAVDVPFGEAGFRLWVDGRAAPPGTTLLLDPGTHRLLAAVRGQLMALRLVPADARLVRAERAKYAWLHADWEAAKARHAETGVIQDIPAIVRMCRVGTRTLYLQQLDRGGRPGRGEDLSLPFVHACLQALGEGLPPDTPLVVAADPGAIRDVDDRHLVFAMGLVPEAMRPALKAEFDRRFLPDGLGRLSSVDLVAALVNYPFERPHASD